MPSEKLINNLICFSNGKTLKAAEGEMIFNRSVTFFIFIRAIKVVSFLIASPIKPADAKRLCDLNLNEARNQNYCSQLNQHLHQK